MRHFKLPSVRPLVSNRIITIGLVCLVVLLVQSLRFKVESVYSVSDGISNGACPVKYTFVFHGARVVREEGLIRQNLKKIATELYNLKLDGRNIGMEALSREGKIREVEPLVILQTIIREYIYYLYPGDQGVCNFIWHKIANEIRFFLDLPTISQRPSISLSTVKSRAIGLTEDDNREVTTKKSDTPYLYTKVPLHRWTVLTLYDKTKGVGGMLYMEPWLVSQEDELTSLINEILKDLRRYGAVKANLEARLIGCYVEPGDEN